MARQLEIESIARTPSFDYARRVLVGLIAGLIVSIVISAGVWSLAVWFPSKASLAEMLNWLVMRGALTGHVRNIDFWINALPKCLAVSADLLHIQTEDAGPLRQIVDVAPGMEEFEHAAMFHCPALLVGQVELPAVGTLITQVLFAVLGRIE
jgi:hypothetical protein